MASIILSTAGAAIGQSTGLPLGATIGGKLGKFVGGLIDERAFGRDVRLNDREGPRLAELAVQTSTYGRMIPMVYGMARIAGNIIWSQPIRETVNSTVSSASAGGGGKGGGGRVTQTTTTYSYSVNLAIGICEGPVSEVLRIWADAKLLDLSLYTLRIYKGDEDQMADTLIIAVEGAGNAPAYRGIAYAVLENFPLGEFGNRIPNFTFEVKKKAQRADYNDQILEEMVTGMVLIPGAGEFVYDTTVQYKVPGTDTMAGWVQQGNQLRLNMHNASGNANVLLALDQLRETCPNIQWISVVVSCFGDSLDAGACVIKPGVEYQTGGITTPDTWRVAGYTRTTARAITLESGSPRFGGTPGDESLLRLLDELRARGYHIMLYPVVFMDIAGKPWRGEITGAAADSASFFTKSEGYNAFALHYATLVNDKVDAFVIGSELKGLTKVTDTPGNYPAVNELVSLAAAVKSTLGPSVKVTYAADWSEYHHTNGGWYNLDPLWSSSDIDMIGIDAYFPLSDAPQSGYDIPEIIAGWTSGEGYEWYYTDPARTIQAPLSPPYAWKNLEWFWRNPHVNPDSTPTGWISESKPIWFTEYGFPSVDGATNQPNVFYDPSTSGSAYPYLSKGRIDFRAQRLGLVATEHQWQTSDVVEQKFIWTWDARPYPYWPDLTSVWSDGAAWKTGHWVQGKLGISNLAAIIANLCERVGLGADDIDVSSVTDQVEGFVITSPRSVRNALEALQQGYFFDTVESDNIVKFVSRGSAAILEINDERLVRQVKNGNSDLLSATRQQEVELPKRVNVLYLNRLTGYQPATQYAQREATATRQQTAIDLPLVLSDQAAKIIADVTLYSAWVQRTSYRFTVPIAYAALEPADVIDVMSNGVTTRMRITEVLFQSPRMLEVHAVAEDVSAYDFYTAPGSVNAVHTEVEPVSKTLCEFLDIAALPNDDPETGNLRFAVCAAGANWQGAVIYRSDDGGVNYARLTDAPASAIMGNAVTVLGSGTTTVFDDVSTVEVYLRGTAELSSVNELAVLNGANAVLVGEEIIQFKHATLLSPQHYLLSGLLRGRMGTEYATSTHTEGERFVVLDGLVLKQSMPLTLLGLVRPYKPVSVGGTLTATDATTFTYTGKGYLPYSPVHITAIRDASGNIALSWIRRTRVGGQWLDYVDTPLNEASEAYEVDILSGVTVVRTINGLVTPTAAYSAAQQTADFGSTQSSLSVRVYQMSGVVGRGIPGIATV